MNIKYSILQKKPHPITKTMRLNMGSIMQIALREQCLRIQGVHIECMYAPN